MHLSEFTLKTRFYRNAQRPPRIAVRIRTSPIGGIAPQAAVPISGAGMHFQTLTSEFLVRNRSQNCFSVSRFALKANIQIRTDYSTDFDLAEQLIPLSGECLTLARFIREDAAEEVQEALASDSGGMQAHGSAGAGTTGGRRWCRSSGSCSGCSAEPAQSDASQGLFVV